MSEVTRILSALSQGDPHAAGQLLPLVYDELRQLAAQKLAQEKPGQTLQATALVHEAYLRLVGGAKGSGDRDQESDRWNGKGHFFGAAAEAMRRILVEQARRKDAKKRGGEGKSIELTDAPADANTDAVDLLALDQALEEFATIDPRSAQLVKLRYFAGFTLKEAAEILDIAPRTADEVWSYAKAWLAADIGPA